MATVTLKFVGDCKNSWHFSSDRVYELDKDKDGDAFVYDNNMLKLYVERRVDGDFVGVNFEHYRFQVGSYDQMGVTYRVSVRCRKTGKTTIAYMGNSETLAKNSYEALANKPDFVRDFRIVLQRLEPVTMMESD